MESMEWKTVQDSRAEQPKEIDAESSASMIYERRNIRRETFIMKNDREQETEIKMWTYEQRAWPREEFERMEQEMESPATRAIMQSISDLQLDIAMAVIGEV